MLFLRLGKLSLGIPGECGTRQEQRRARIRGAAHKRRFASHPRIAQGRAIAMHGIAPSRRALSAPLPSHPSRALPPRASLPAAFRCPAHLTQVYRTPASDRNQRRSRFLHLNGKNRTSGAGENGRRETQLATLPSRRSREGWAERNEGRHGKGKRSCFKEASPLPALSLDVRSNLLRHAEALEGLKQRQPQHVHDKRLA